MFSYQAYDIPLSVSSLEEERLRLAPKVRAWQRFEAVEACFLDRKQAFLAGFAEELGNSLANQADEVKDSKVGFRFRKTNLESRSCWFSADFFFTKCRLWLSMVTQVKALEAAALAAEQNQHTLHALLSKASEACQQEDAALQKQQKKLSRLSKQVKLLCASLCHGTWLPALVIGQTRLRNMSNRDDGAWYSKRSAVQLIELGISPAPYMVVAGDGDQHRRCQNRCTPASSPESYCPAEQMQEQARQGGSQPQKAHQKIEVHSLVRMLNLDILSFLQCKPVLPLLNCRIGPAPLGIACMQKHYRPFRAEASGWHRGEQDVLEDRLQVFRREHDQENQALQQLAQAMPLHLSHLKVNLPGCSTLAPAPRRG